MHTLSYYGTYGANGTCDTADKCDRAKHDAYLGLEKWVELQYIMQALWYLLLTFLYESIHHKLSVEWLVSCINSKYNQGIHK